MPVFLCSGLVTKLGIKWKAFSIPIAANNLSEARKKYLEATGNEFPLHQGWIGPGIVLIAELSKENLERLAACARPRSEFIDDKVVSTERLATVTT